MENEATWRAYGSMFARIAGLFLIGYAVAAVIWPPEVTGGTFGAGDRGIAGAQQTLILHQETDPDLNVTWQVVAYRGARPSEYCIDLMGTKVSGDPIGGPGGCGTFGARVSSILSGAGNLSNQSVEMVPITGTMLVPQTTPGGAIPGTQVSLVGGVVTCHCGVRVSWSDGTSTTSETGSGAFLAWAPGDVAVRRLEVIAANGSVLEASS